MGDVYDLAIATIFAREFLEGAIIVGQYRTILLRSDVWQEPEKQKAGLRAITVAAALAMAVAVVMTICIAIPLVILSNELNDKVIEIIEGTSKLIAAVCILQLSLKIPTWLGLYASKHDDTSDMEVGMTLKAIRFNVAWNVWREVAECGVFLIPFLVAGDGKAIPVSAIVGIVIALALGLLIYYGNKRMKSKVYLAFFMSTLLGMMSVGLFANGCHEFEEVLGETRTVYTVKNDFWSDSKLPMSLLKPFGYSSSRSLLRLVTFWVWTFLLIAGHVWKWQRSKKIRQARAMTKAERSGRNLDKTDLRGESGSDLDEIVAHGRV